MVAREETRAAAQNPLAWVFQAACKDLPDADVRRFHMPGAKKLAPDLERLCKVECRVRIQCVTFAYEHQMHGHVGAVSAARRRKQPLDTTIAQIKAGEL